MKHIRGHAYIYDQATRRENGKTFTRNRYIGPVGGMAMRASLAGHHNGYAMPGGGVAGAAPQENRAWQSQILTRVQAVMSALEGNRFAKEELGSRAWLTDKPELTATRLVEIDGMIEGELFAREQLAEVVAELRGKGREALAARNRAVLQRWPADHLNFNLEAFVRSATAIGVDLEQELVRVDGKPTTEARIEAMHRLWGLLHEQDRFAGVRSRLAHLRDAAVGEDDEAVARLGMLLDEGRELDVATLKEEMEEIAERAEAPFVRREVGEIMDRLIQPSSKERSVGEIAKAAGERLERELFANTLRKFARHQKDVDRWRGWAVPIGDGMSLRAGDVVDVSGVLFQITNVLDIGAGRTYQIDCGQDLAWQFVSATTLEAAERLGLAGLEGQ